MLGRYARVSYDAARGVATGSRANAALAAILDVPLADLPARCAAVPDHGLPVLPLSLRSPNDPPAPTQAV
jgi:hypothetical protein